MPVRSIQAFFWAVEDTYLPYKVQIRVKISTLREEEDKSQQKKLEEIPTYRLENEGITGHINLTTLRHAKPNRTD